MALVLRKNLFNKRTLLMKSLKLRPVSTKVLRKSIPTGKLYYYRTDVVVIYLTTGIFYLFLFL